MGDGIKIITDLTSLRRKFPLLYSPRFGECFDGSQSGKDLCIVWTNSQMLLLLPFNIYLFGNTTEFIKEIIILKKSINASLIVIIFYEQIQRSCLPYISWIKLTRWLSVANVYFEQRFLNVVQSTFPLKNDHSCFKNI